MIKENKAKSKLNSQKAFACLNKQLTNNNFLNLITQAAG